MAIYSSIPSRQGTAYMGSGSGLGGWLTGMGQSMYQGLARGIDMNNALREMNSQNFLQPYALSAGANRLTSDRLRSLAEAEGHQLVLDTNRDARVTPAAAAVGLSGTLNAPPTSEQQLTDQQRWQALARTFGESAVNPASADPFFSSGMGGASQLLGLYQRPFAASGF